MTPPKEAHNTLIAGTKNMEIYKLPDKEFSIVILMKLSEMQENRNRQNRQQTQSRKQCMNKMRSLIERQRLLERTKQKSRAAEYNDSTEKLNRELQQQT